MFGKYDGKEQFYFNEFIAGRMENPVEILEASFSLAVNYKYAIAVNSGTSALHAALEACEVDDGEVLVTALCPAMVIFAIIHAGAKPIFVDVDKDTMLMDLEDAKKKTTDNTLAVLAVSLNGLPVDWKPFAKFVKDKVLWTIDDCAQALGATRNNEVQADISCYSFEDKKHITTGSEGGMICTNHEGTAKRARKFAGLGYKHMTATAGRTSLSAETYQDPDYMRFDVIGLNYRMSKIQAIMGIAQLERLPHIIAQRRAVARMFFDATNSPSDFDPPWGTHSYYTFPVSYDGNWKEFYNKFKSMGGDGFYAAPQVAYNEPALNEYRGDCPIAEDIQKKLMLFKTNHRNLGEAEIQCRLLNSLIFPAKPQLSLVERAFSVNATVKSSKNLAENPSQPI